MTCDVCGLPDPYNGTGDGIGSCDCPRGDCGEPDWSMFCTCPTEDDGPACWELKPGGGVRCGLDVDHEGEHAFTIWEGPPAAVSASHDVQTPGHHDNPHNPAATATAPHSPHSAPATQHRNEETP